MPIDPQDPNGEIRTTPQEAPCLPTGSAQRPAIDISHRSIRLGRLVDRLGPGTYTVTITKGDKSQPWRIRVEQGTSAREMELEP